MSFNVNINRHTSTLLKYQNTKTKLPGKYYNRQSLVISQYSFAHNCHFLFLRFKVQALISSPPPDLPQKILRQFLRHAKNLFTNIWLHGVIKNYHPAVIHRHNSTCGLRHSWAESSQAANLDERHAPSYQGVSCLTESLTTA